MVYLLQKPSADRNAGARNRPMNPRQENRIVARVQDGRREEFARLVRGYQQALFRIVGNLLPPSRVEDVVQEVFLAAFAAIERFDPRRGSFRTWLFAIARNRARNARRKRREERLPDDHPLPYERTPHDELQTREVFRRLDRALKGLRFEERVVFVLAELEGLTYAEIARIEGVKLGTVKSRLARARARLRRELEGVG